ncbi:MAG TPA: TonB family protein [Terriglobales bacterium]
MAKKLKSSPLRTPEVAAPALLVTLEPRLAGFLGNFSELFRPQPVETNVLTSTPGEFWPDVFVRSKLPWGRFAESAIFHVAAVAMIWGSVQLWPQPTQVVAHAATYHPEVLYYEAPEYLQPLNTAEARPHVAQRGDPAYSRQPIISVPKEPDNKSQTIVAPPQMKLNHDVPLPNIVAQNKPAPMVPLEATSLRSRIPVTAADVVAPAPDIANAHGSRNLPTSSAAVVSPAPDVNAINSRRTNAGAQPSVIDPPPAVDSTTTRRMGDINIAASQVVAPAPKLPVDAQMASSRSLASGNGAGSAGSGAVVPPPPSVGASGSGAGRLIALNLHPAAASGPVETPAGNRMGAFATTPDGKAGASGTPNISGDASGHDAGSMGKSGWGSAGVPQGLQVGAAPKGSTTGNAGGGSPSFTQVAKATLPHELPVSRSTTTESSSAAPTDMERKVFGVRKLYTMTLNTPNLNSGGGSWVMRFAEFKEDPQDKSELTAPVAVQEVDPGYPLELMRQNVQGTVTLLAVIHADGTVGDVSVLSGIDDRLDQYARSALGRWKFRPAEKNGKPVALQALVKIPFKPTLRNGF